MCFCSSRISSYRSIGYPRTWGNVIAGKCIRQITTEISSVSSMSNASTLPASITGWAHMDARRDEEIDYSDDPEITPEMVAKARGEKASRLCQRRCT